MNNSILLLFPILLPIIFGTLIVFGKKLCKTIRLRVISTIALLISAAFSLYNIFFVDSTLSFGYITDNLSVALRIDDTGRFFAGLVTFVWILVLFYSFEYLKHEENENQFIGFYLITYGILMGLDFSENMLTMYIFYELMTMLTVPLVIHTRTKEAISAGLKYLIYSLVGAFMGLLGIFFVNQYGTGLSFSPGGVLNMNAVNGNEPLILVIVFLMLIGFGTKAGMFPLHGWLPTAHPAAPAPASAILSGIITKSGVLAIIRVVYYIIGPDFIRGTWVQYTWMALTLITVIMGSMMAYREKLFKKRLAYSTVSQVSYMLFGLSTLNSIGFTGALLHVVFHSLIKNALFLVAGAIIYKTGLKNVDEYAGIGKRMPKTMTMYSIVSLSLIGIPPLSGFVSKWYLATGGLDTGIPFFSWFGAAALLISALLTAGYLLPPAISGFFPGKGTEIAEKCEPSALMLVPIGIFTAATIVFGIMPGGLIDFISSIAGTLI